MIIITEFSKTYQHGQVSQGAVVGLQTLFPLFKNGHHIITHLYTSAIAKIGLFVVARIFSHELTIVCEFQCCMTSNPF